MQFVRKKKRGVNQKVARVWYSEEGYRIYWRREVCGARVPGRYQACVRSVLPNYGGTEGNAVLIWDFLSRPKLYKTLKAAEDDCEKHRRRWEKACSATGVRVLLDIFEGQLPVAIPIWVKKAMDRRALAVLMALRTRKYMDEDECDENPSDLTATSDSSSGNTEPAKESSIPVSTVEVKAPTPCISPGESSAPAPTVMVPAKAPKKRASKDTAKSSKRTVRKNANTKRSSNSTSKPSAGSRAKKSKP